MLKVPDIIRWCDDIIEEDDKPDTNIIELSMAPKNVHEILKHLSGIGASETLTEEMCLTVTAAGYFTGKLKMENARSYLFQRICIEEDREMTPLMQEIYLFDDECDWDHARAKDRLERLLAPYKCKADLLQRSLSPPKKIMK